MEHSNFVMYQSALADIPVLDDQGGIGSRRILEKLDDLIDCLNAQGKQLNEWREKAVQILSMPLVDEDDEETTGEEYETSAKAQDELQVCHCSEGSIQVIRSECS